MPSGYLYLGEATGARVLRVGIGTALLSGGSLFEAWTWDDTPGGENGDVHFREIAVTFRHTNGYTVTLTPYVDGIPGEAQQFSGGPPQGGADDDLVTCLVAVSDRGTRTALLMASTSFLGELELVDIQPGRTVITGAN